MKKPDAKQRILQTASNLFHRMGYSCVGINEIISKSETAKATFYHHFPTKQSLCEAWLDEIHERSERHRAELLAADRPVREKVAQYFDELGAFLTKSDFRGCPYTNTAAVVPREDRELIRHIVEHKESLRQFFRALAGAVVERADRAEALGDALFLLYSGATTEAQNLGALWPVETAKRTALEILEREV